MITIPPLVLALIILWKESALFYYHRTMPMPLRAAMVLPGGLLAVVYLALAFAGNLLNPLYEHAVTNNTLFFFFLWNGILVFVTRRQHSDVKWKAWKELHNALSNNSPTEPRQ